MLKARYTPCMRQCFPIDPPKTYDYATSCNLKRWYLLKVGRANNTWIYLFNNKTSPSSRFLDVLDGPVFCFIILHSFPFCRLLRLL